MLALGITGAGTALGGCSPSDPGPADEPGPPSIVLISIDTLRADHLGLYGYERDTSPYLDRFAQEALVFERAFAPAPWTLISHMTMLTGLYPNQHGVVSGELALAEETPILAETLARRGYHTVGLYHEGWIHARHGFDRGFDLFRSHENAEEAHAHLTEVVETLGPARPFFLFLHLFDVHSGPLSKEPGPIYDCPPPYDELFLPGAAERLPQVPEGELWIRPGAFEPQALEALTALYDGGIRYVDDKLATWIEDWRARGWLEHTAVILTADHGESLGQRGRGIRDHGGPYQEGLRVPLLVRPPGGVEGPRRIEATVHLADVVPTALELAGVPSERLPGLSLLGELPAERTVYAYSPDSFEMVVRWPYKWVRLATQGLYAEVDLATDPEELVGGPLSAEEFERRRAAFLEGAGSATPFAPPRPAHEIEDDEALLQRLGDLGYAQGESP